MTHRCDPRPAVSHDAESDVDPPSPAWLAVRALATCGNSTDSRQPPQELTRCRYLPSSWREDSVALSWNLRIGHAELLDDDELVGRRSTAGGDRDEPASISGCWAEGSRSWYAIIGEPVEAAAGPQQPGDAATPDHTAGVAGGRGTIVSSDPFRLLSHS